MTRDNDVDATYRTDRSATQRSVSALAARPTPVWRAVFVGDVGIVAVDHAIAAGGIQVGRKVDGSADIVVEGDKSVSRVHARVERKDDVVRIVNKSQSGTQVNGVAVDAHVLQDGDVIRVGNSFAVFRLVPSDQEDAPLATLLGRSPSAAQLRAFVALVAKKKNTVLLQGETGTGKEVVANAIHQQSGRSGAFVAVNCAAIPETLAEAQFFGHKAGAFTGATTAELGWFRRAEGGTLFLDELGELPLSLQAKLLRALDERKITPVGMSTAVDIDVRVVAATNRDLVRDIEKGAFRADLYARLAELTLALAPLRDRREDVLQLMQAALPPDAPPLSADLVEMLLLHRWPFNVREVGKIAAELAVKGEGKKRLDLSLVAARMSPRPAREASPVHAQEDISASEAPEHSGATVRKQRPTTPAPTADELRALLVQHKGSIAPVAQAIGRSRMQVYRLVEQYGIDVDAIRLASG